MQTQIKGNFLKDRIVQPTIGFIKSGVSPEQLAVAFSLGIVVGVIPLLGCTTLICMGLAFSLRLNMAALQLINYLMFPLQLLLFIPFFHAGGYIFEPLEIPVSVASISEMMSNDFWGTIGKLWLANLQALLVWLALAIPSYFVLYAILSRTLKRVSFALQRKP